jgi:hypothetical protein
MYGGRMLFANHRYDLRFTTLDGETSVYGVHFYLVHALGM